MCNRRRFNHDVRRTTEFLEREKKLVQRRTFLQLNYRAQRREPLQSFRCVRNIVQAQIQILERLADDQRRGWLSEASWRVKENFRFGLGYNFTDFSDNELSTNDYEVGGWFLRIQGMY